MESNLTHAHLIVASLNRLESTRRTYTSEFIHKGVVSFGRTISKRVDSSKCVAVNFVVNKPLLRITEHLQVGAIQNVQLSSDKKLFLPAARKCIPN